MDCQPFWELGWLARITGELQLSIKHMTRGGGVGGKRQLLSMTLQREGGGAG